MNLRRHPLATIAVLATLAFAPPAAGREAASQDQMDALVARLSKDVERLRGRAFLRPVAVRRIGDAEAREHFRTRLLEALPEEKLATDNLALHALGLLPADADLLQTMLDLLEEQAAGFYDPKRDTFFLMEDAPETSLPAVIVHELTHALDDQHFGLDAMVAKLAHDDDASAAYAAVVEGSGSLVMSAWLVEELKAGRMNPGDMAQMVNAEAARGARLRAAPAVLQRSLMGPYVLGQAFLLRGDLMALVRGVAAADVDASFQSPPRSTEQVIHAEKYWKQAEEPVALQLGDLAAPLGPGARKVGDGRLGELLMALVTKGGAIDPQSPAALDPKRWTTKGARGWAGDQYQVYETTDGPVTLLGTVWDSEEEAAEFTRELAVPRTCAPFRSGPAVLLACGPTARGANVAPLALSRAREAAAARAR